MKKITALLLALLMLFVFAACGASDKDDKKADKDNEEINQTLAGDNNSNTEDTPVFDINPDDTPVVDIPATNAPTVKTDEQKVAEYVALYSKDLIDSFEAGLVESSGLTCSSTASAVGTGIVLNININEINNLTADQKATIQDNFDQMSPSLVPDFNLVKSELPELTYIKFYICESDGDHIATLYIDQNTAGSSSSAPSVDVPVTSTPDNDAAQKVASYINLNKAELINSFESAFTSSGMTCSTTIDVEGTGFILTVCINELDNLTADQKSMMQSTYDSMSDTFSASLDMMQTDIPELTYYKVIVCEGDGDYIATITAQ